MNCIKGCFVWCDIIIDNKFIVWNWKRLFIIKWWICKNIRFIKFNLIKKIGVILMK